jgi:hypothetical protein
MNFSQRWPAGQATLIDQLLVDVAVKIQLPPSLHEKAVEHYRAINKHLDREDSPLRYRVVEFYPQGSMAIGATIKSGDEDDIFDIDLVAEVILPGKKPGEVLDLLFDAINGPKGSIYHGMVERQTRCVTVNYRDMHLDVTPLFRNGAWEDRGGHICHAKPEEAEHRHGFVAANPWGFARWFGECTPADDWFRKLVLTRSYAADAQLVAKDAAAQPVPEHEPIYAKAMVVVALQLMKRWVRINHRRNGSRGRCVPSVVLSRSFASNAGRTSSLLEELIFQAAILRDELYTAAAKRELIDWRNPRLWQDVLTDRWPGDAYTQLAFAEDVDAFVRKLEGLRHTDDMRLIQKTLAELFGERTSASVMDEYYERGGAEIARGQARVSTATGASLAGLTQAPGVASVTSPKHTFYGD